MKKFVLLITLFVGNIMLTFAQSDTIIYIANQPGYTYVCLNRHDRVLVYAEDGCNDFYWYIGGHHFHENPLVFEGEYEASYSISYWGCDFNWGFYIYFTDDRWVPTPFTHHVWKRQNEVMTLQAVGNDSTGWYNYHWSIGETTASIEVDTGSYSCTITDPWACGSAVRTFIVQDNVELYRATVDLETNLNKVTWQTDESQAEYISQVKVYRDGFFVGTAPYENGYFLDAIGSDNAARNYQIVGVTSEGEDCPIASHQKGTIHTTYYLDVNDNLNMTWNIPYVEQGAQGTLTYFQVCKYDPITEQLTVVDQVNSLITDYTCGVNQFAGGYPVIAAVFSNSKDREFEDMSFSNMYTDIAIQPQEITIILTPGWNWISYPYAVSMGIDEALGDFIPVEGDIIKSRLVSSSYTNGRWRGGVSHFMPGWGYMYYSSRNEPATLVFDLSSSR